MNPTTSTPSTSSRPADLSLPALTPQQALERLRQQTRRRTANPETALKAACLQMLRLMQIEAWPQQSGGIPIQGPKGRRFIRLGRTGAADITGILNDGRRLEVECKTLQGKLRPEQLFFLQMINDKGGVALMVRSAQELRYKLTQRLASTPRPDRNRYITGG